MPPFPIKHPPNETPLLARTLTCLCLLVLITTPLMAVAGDRIFTTADQRARIDQLRAQTTAKEMARQPDPRSKTAKPTPSRPPPQVHVRGFVRRSDGPSAVWVNSGSNLPGKGIGEGISTGSVEGQTVRVRLPNGKFLRLEPGQTWDPEDGTVSDADGN